jgi:hypothetical protein
MLRLHHLGLLILWRHASLLAAYPHNLVCVVNRLHGRDWLVAEVNLFRWDDPVEPRRHQQTQDNGWQDEMHDAETVDHDGVEHVLGCELGVSKGEDNGENGARDVLCDKTS